MKKSSLFSVACGLLALGLRVPLLGVTEMEKSLVAGEQSKALMPYRDEVAETALLWALLKNSPRGAQCGDDVLRKRAKKISAIIAHFPLLLDKKGPDGITPLVYSLCHCDPIIDGAFVACAPGGCSYTPTPPDQKKENEAWAEELADKLIASIGKREASLIYGKESKLRRTRRAGQPYHFTITVTRRGNKKLKFKIRCHAGKDREDLGVLTYTSRLEQSPGKNRHVRIKFLWIKEKRSGLGRALLLVPIKRALKSGMPTRISLEVVPDGGMFVPPIKFYKGFDFAPLAAGLSSCSSTVDMFRYVNGAKKEND